MKRIHIFEFLDLEWFPDMFRHFMTRYLMQLHKIVGTSRSLVPILEEMISKTNKYTIYDLCSGSGGPIIDTVLQLRKTIDVHLILSDKYPPIEFNNEENIAVTYQKESRDILEMPFLEDGIYTLIASFHHFDSNKAHKILEKITQKQHPICIFELSDNSFPIWLWWIPIIPNLISTFLLTLLIRPINWKQFLFTYLIPILPFCIAWDGAVSNARTYTKSDWDILTRSLNNYDWEVRKVENKTPFKMLVVLGYPKE